MTGKVTIRFRSFVTPYANDFDAMIPELWAQEGLAILEENMVAAQLVHRDFEPLVARFGDTINTRRPSEFTAKRRPITADVALQDATAASVQVPLNQLVYVSFLLRDGEEAYSFKNLVEIYLRSAMIAQARFLDRLVLSQYAHFLGNSYPLANQLSSSNAVTGILGTRQVLNQNKAYETGRHMIWNPTSETHVLSNAVFHSAEKVGDDGTALREASLGRKLGFDHYMAQNMPSILDAAVDVNVVATVDGAHSKGATVIATDNGAAITANSWVKIGGGVYRVASYSAPTLTLTTGLKNDVADNEVISWYGTGAVNNGAGYPVGWAEPIAFDGFTKNLQVGQIVSFGDSPSAAIYTIVEMPTSSTIMLDRPLEAALVDDALLKSGPATDFNFAFHRNAIALVTRPMAAVRAQTGALSAFVNNNGFSMRATLSYDGIKAGTIVTLDMLCGIKVLDTNLGAVLLG